MHCETPSRASVHLMPNIIPNQNARKIILIKRESPGLKYYHKTQMEPKELQYPFKKMAEEPPTTMRAAQLFKSTDGISQLKNIYSERPRQILVRRGTSKLQLKTPLSAASKDDASPTTVHKTSRRRFTSSVHVTTGPISH